MEQVVDGLLAERDAELGGQHASDVGVVEGTDAVLGSRPGLDPPAQAVVLGGVEPGLTAAARAIGQGVGAAVVVAAGPLLDGAGRAAQGRGDLGGGQTAGGQDDPPEPTPEARRRLVGGELLESFGGEMGLDVHRGGSSLEPRS